MKATDQIDPADASASHRARARSDQLRLLFRQSAHAVYMALVGASLWLALIWQAAERSALIVWISALAITTLLRAMLFAAYARVRPEGDQIHRWARPYGLTLVAAVLVWGVGCVWVTPSDSLLHQTLTFACLVCMSGVAISTYATLARLTSLVLIILIAPIVLQFLIQGGPTRNLLAAAGLLYLLAAVRGVSVHSFAVERSFRLGHELNDANRAVSLEANLDPLTGIFNRRGFLAAADRILRRAQGEGRPATMLAIDVDDLKVVNDRHGHAAGDAVLRHVADVLKTRLRVSDVCGRLGGDELAILLPNTTAAEARGVAEKVQAGASSEPLEHAGVTIPVTLSIGLASHTTDVEELLNAADRAMYTAKNSGKDGLMMFEP
jgi:diguanylate cyclase (GGDEF)-like protein